MTDRKPFIKKRPSEMKRPGEDAVELGAGAQSLIMSVSSFSSLGRAGAKVDLSWSEPDQPLLICAPLESVAVPTYHFGHKTNRTYFFASEIVTALSELHASLETMTDAEFREKAKEVMRKIGLYVRE